MSTVAPGQRVPTRPEDNAAMAAQAETLTQLGRLATLAIMPPEAIAQMGEVGLAGSSIQAALTAVLRTSLALQVSTYDGLAFTVGLAFGEILRNAEVLNLGVAMDYLGQGIAYALDHGRQPAGGMQ